MTATYPTMTPWMATSASTGIHHHAAMRATRQAINLPTLEIPA